MAHNTFSRIGIEVSDGGEWLFRQYFNTMIEAYAKAKDQEDRGFEVRFCTADKYGNVIEYI